MKSKNIVEEIKAKDIAFEKASKIFVKLAKSKGDSNIGKKLINFEYQK